MVTVCCCGWPIIIAFRLTSRCSISTAEWESIRSFREKARSIASNRVRSNLFAFGSQATTSGLEHVVVVAVKGTSGQPAEFSALAMPTLEEAQAAERTRGGSKGPATPLGQLLYQAMFKGGVTRGAAPDELDEYRLDLHSWRVAPKVLTP